ncbi:hypothetical protein FBEOM_3562 [Fusarium beomiforme]|uniref:2EXR domain-containing protein n=1 Tax=Fusarium beomiforme TaxID=44412 RepID=A0A9P5DZ17_9HYPO|nr:hypothetical protein FBEOM_3562 [Fusarium beomiforme]
MDPSEAPAANADLTTFTCFPRLPKEIRLMIWECLIPPTQDLRIGYVDSIATPWPTPGYLMALHRALKHRAAAGHRQIKAIYIGLSRQLKDWRCLPVSEDAGFRLVGIDGEKLPKHFRFVADLSGPDGYDADPPISNSAWIPWLKDSWMDTRAAQELRSTWQELTSDEGSMAPVLKPVIIFTRCDGALHGGCDPLEGQGWGLTFRID